MRPGTRPAGRGDIAAIPVDRPGLTLVRLVGRLSNPGFQEILEEALVTRQVTRATPKGELEGGA